MALQRALFFCLIFSSLTDIFALPKEQELDRILALPEQPPVKFSQFSGYVTVDEEHGRALFYWLTEATDNADAKPLVLWLNGGPGCSSVAYGASEEIGPFRIHKNGSLYLNKYSWNRVANIIFLESPAGVGYSYTNTSTDLKDSGDKRTAKDALNFLIRWMSRFPQYKYRDFYISGESYAGNAVTDNYYDGIGTVTYWWSHAMISDKTYKSILKNCNFRSEKTSDKCDEAVDYAMNHEFGDIDQYSIYTPTCASSKKRPNISPSLKNSLIGLRFSGYDPCTETYAENYYNSPHVQKALHANITGIPYKWTACSDVLIRNWKDSDNSILPIYKKLIAGGLRIWVFSGDTDSVVPVTATRFSLSHLNLKIKKSWYPWYSAGQPRRGFILFQTFLSGRNLPNSSRDE
ncbi:alpha/beta-Hydrolases superfamily protein [Perilla frutescens var. hirtella]|nr:alpha/beta-Hydrolases superfamily protein [Perilla frutescens var. hirtella]KAH6817443.1 alpha/beta-Hydrolases superfamily protein [Perilla frutescens var. frutescens]